MEKAVYSIQDIENAINVWRNVASSNASHAKQDAQILVLGAEARALADVYAVMIYNRAESIGEDDLTEAQRAALAGAAAILGGRTHTGTDANPENIPMVHTTQSR